MSQFFYIHPDNPQARLINQAVEIVRKGGVIVYPTDSGYALGCKIEDKGAMERICRIRHLPDGHNFTLMCRDLSELKCRRAARHDVLALQLFNQQRIVQRPGGQCRNQS
jgi:tRNA threonylcarbamoyl adenosine modification protein (Sua5/YciO/YrdC/YwlC family)